jgi:hypothetical protein
MHISIHTIQIKNKKTKALLFGPPRTEQDLTKNDEGRTYFPVFLNFNNPGETNITKISCINLIPNPEESSAKLLGLLIDSKLNLKQHFIFLHTKVARANFSLNQMKHLLDKQHLLLLYNAYLKSNLEYCCPLFVLANKGTIKTISQSHKKSIRSICSAGFLDHTGPLFKQEGILPFDKLIEFNVARFMYKYRHGSQPDIFNGTWKKVSEMHDYPVRNADDFHIPYFRSMYLKSHPLFSFPLIWNSLPRDIKESRTLKEFSSKMHSKLIEEIETVVGLG